MNILILGIGFLGQRIYHHLCSGAKRSSHSVTILSKAELDYTSFNVLYEYLMESYHGYDFVINASGYTGVPNIDAAEDDKEQCWKLNVEVPVTISSACRASGSIMIHISSGCIFNGYDKNWNEYDTPNWGLFNSNSSFYSKSKHAAETLIMENAICLRIRMPFSSQNSPRNYFTKLLNYNNLISMENSVTCVEDLCESISNILNRKHRDYTIPFGAYHLVNEGTLTAKQVIECLNKYGLTNPNHRFITISDLHTKAIRSNCILSTEYTKSILGAMPSAIDSLEKCAKQYASLVNTQYIDYSI